MFIDVPLIKVSVILFLLAAIVDVHAQENPVKSGGQQQQTIPDDPSQFISRLELFNEFHRFDKDDYYLNITTLRTFVKVGKRFSTRLDIPYVYNTRETKAENSPSGLGDISFRLLGYKIIESRKSALTISMEVSLNTAASPILGTGKNMLIPMVTYSRVVKPGKAIFSLAFEQFNSISGDSSRDALSFSKIQAVYINRWGKRTWAVISPEFFIDYVHGGVSMNIETRFTHALSPRINLALQFGVGLFGDFPSRYDWFTGVGVRYFLFRK